MSIFTQNEVIQKFKGNRDGVGNTLIMTECKLRSLIIIISAGSIISTTVNYSTNVHSEFKMAQPIDYESIS